MSGAFLVSHMDLGTQRNQRALQTLREPPASKAQKKKKKLNQQHEHTFEIEQTESNTILGFILAHVSDYLVVYRSGVGAVEFMICSHDVREI